MSFSDDEPPPDISSSAAGSILWNTSSLFILCIDHGERNESWHHDMANMHAGPYNKPIQGDRVRLVAHSNEEAPLEENTQQVLLEIIDMSSPVERAGLDLVAVLDVSGSMGGEKIEKMKTAMKFVISKLGPNDRLCIVSFSTKAERPRPLLWMTRASQEMLKDAVDNLKANGGTNMEAGLKTGLKVLGSRRHSGGRVGSIILMSDGEESPGSKARTVNIGNVAVYTFGFGERNDAKACSYLCLLINPWLAGQVLEAIASKSQGGTFYFVRDGESLSEHFSRILAGLLSIVVQDLQLTVWQHRGYSMIDEDKVHAGGYPKTADAAAGSVTINFGDLYSGEVRKVIVDLLLPAVHREYPPTTVLCALCQYRTKGQDLYSPQDYLRCDMRRTRTARPHVMRPKVKAELVRLSYADTLKQVSELKEEDFDLAKRKLEEAKNDLDAEQSSNPRLPLINLLRNELMLLLSLATWKEFISSVLAFWTWHRLQRFGIFHTRLMDKYAEQAIEFDKNPGMPPPSVEEEVVEMVRWRKPPGAMGPSRTPPRIPEHRSSAGWAWRALIILCTALAIALIVAGAAVFAVYLLYQPKTPYLVVSDARLVQLQYGQDGAIQYLQASVTILAENSNSKASASFSSVDLALAFHDADVALLRADPFVVAPKSSLPLRYNVVSAGTALDAAGKQAMDEALKAGVVPLDLVGKARTRWKVGVFVKVKFWTRISCRLRFFFPGNGTVMPDDRQRCRSKSP
ncbi:hypothetical protein EJB05_34366, partial [Eragrostis curvula]